MKQRGETMFAPRQVQRVREFDSPDALNEHLKMHAVRVVTMTAVTMGLPASVRLVVVLEDQL